MKRQLIILYGSIGSLPDLKYQGLINEEVNCGYREYAELFGDIIYLRPQVVHKSWEHSFTTNQAIQFCNDRPHAIVWSVKWDPFKDKILKQIQNKKLYYSCNNKNMFSNNVDINLVDTEERCKLHPKAKLFVKGKNTSLWQTTNSKRYYDYVLMGKRADKNEFYFLEQLTKQVKEKRKVLWIGGDNIVNTKPIKTHHYIQTTIMLTRNEVIHYLNLCKIGILFTEHPTEGFPQSFIEMAMCGVPIIYNANAPINEYYNSEYVTMKVKFKQDLIVRAEEVLSRYNDSYDDMAVNCEVYAELYFDINKSYQRMVEYAKQS